MLRLHSWAILFFGLLCAWPSLAEELRYDNGEVRGALQGLEAGQVEAQRLTTVHPSRLKYLNLAFSQVGTVEVHVWPDNGGQQPDLDADLVAPMVVETDEQGRVTLTLDPPLDLDPEIHFFVGHVLQEDEGPGLLVDSSQDAVCRALLYAWSSDLGSMSWFVIAEEVEGERVCRNYMLGAWVQVHDVVLRKRFVDVSEETGYGSARRVAVVDWDGDGDLDVLQNGQRLLRNDGGIFEDISQEVGLGEYPSVTGGVFGDYDRDGDLDLFLYVSTCCDEAEAGGVHDRLLRNDDGVFVDATGPEGPFDFFPNQSAAWGDVDNDGWLDLILPGYERSGQLAVPSPDSFWRNRGDGSFEDYSQESWLSWSPDVCSRTVTWADYDMDGWQDLYIGAYRLQRNYLFHNSGGDFEEEGSSSGTAGLEAQGSFGHSIGAAWGDLDNDGDLDLVVMNLAHPRFYAFSDFSKIYLNRFTESGERRFEDVRQAAGVRVVETASEPALGDVDCDGDLDLFQTNVYEGRESNLWISRLVDDGEFVFGEESYEAGARVDDGWGAVWADFDGDGDLDLFSRRLFRNDGPQGHWLKVRLTGGEAVDTHGTGAVVTVVAGKDRYTRLVSAGKGVGNQNPFELHFGLGGHERYDAIEIRWPGGQLETQPCGAADQGLWISQGQRLEPGPACPDPDGEEGVEGGGCACGAENTVPWVWLWICVMMVLVWRKSFRPIF